MVDGQIHATARTRPSAAASSLSCVVTANGAARAEVAAGEEAITLEVHGPRCPPGAGTVISREVRGLRRHRDLSR